jgi:2-polyprenyl-3-methyl-5-hydroxy-6-metoxy-1,4-benzoquinol methylase
MTPSGEQENVADSQSGGLVKSLRRAIAPLGRIAGRRAPRGELERFGTWTYPFDLGDGVTTPVHPPWLLESHETRTRMVFSPLDEAFAGRWQEITCLDIACNEGFFGIEVRRRGAKAVVAFDARQVNIDKAEFVKRRYGLDRIDFHVEDIAGLTPERFGTFDLTLCLGLLYHLENPMDALRRIRAVTRELCVIDTQVLRESPPVTTAWITEERLIETRDVIGIIEEPDSVWNPAASVTGMSLVVSYAALLTMLRHAGFREVTRVEPYEGCFEPYATSDRVVLLARV